ncbi:hypothetical protein [Pseudonocardia pini]|uniref:hypothetical protein n=1 Tax=Pseudonocardia pini TaxID=2758030 RepID=UPI0015F0D132|nr:hypothetical protein [Pseudonocardia pini]
MPALRVRAQMPTALGAVAGLLVFGLTHSSLVDDAYITLTYGRTLGLHGEWGMYPGLPSNTATSPLNVLLLGAGTAVTGDAMAGLGVLVVVIFALAGHWLDGLGRMLRIPRWRAPMLGIAFLGTSPLLLSTVGLESYLAVTLMLGLAHYTVAGRRWASGVLAGLLVLTRPDLAVVSLVGVLAGGRNGWRVAVSAAGTALPWFVLSWLWLDSAVPDTMLLKAGLTWGQWNYGTGVLLWQPIFPSAVILSVLPAAIGLLALPFWIRSRVRPVGLVLGVGALAHGAAFLMIGTAPFHWGTTPRWWAGSVCF